MIPDIILRDRGYQQYHLAPNHYQLLPKSHAKGKPNPVEYFCKLNITHSQVNCAILCIQPYKFKSIEIFSKKNGLEEPARDFTPLSTNQWLTNYGPMTDHPPYVITYQFFWLESYFLVIFEYHLMLVLTIHWFFTVIPNIYTLTVPFLLLFRCCDNE